METITFTVNGVSTAVETAAQRPLLDVLREDLDLTGTKYGCGEGSCRSCTVLMDGKAVSSCLTKVGDAAGKSVTTIEGLARDGRLHPMQQAFIDEMAMQCGYCVPGMILTAVALLETNPSPTRAEIVRWMNGNLCRCCNYDNIVRAIERGAAQGPGSGGGR